MPSVASALFKINTPDGQLPLPEPDDVPDWAAIALALKGARS